jgi:hypothetical protein
MYVHVPQVGIYWEEVFVYVIDTAAESNLVQRIIAKALFAGLGALCVLSYAYLSDHPAGGAGTHNAVVPSQFRCVTTFREYKAAIRAKQIEKLENVSVQFNKLSASTHTPTLH